MRVLVCGAGSIGRRHIGNLLALGCEVVVMDERREAVSAARSEFSVPAVTTDEPFLNTGSSLRDVDAYVIATPLDTHLEYVTHMALVQGKPFFVEKPLGTPEQLPRWREVAAECEQRKLIWQVGYMLRFHPAAQALRSVRDPLIGRFTCDAMMSTWPGQSYGPALLELSHEIDIALHCGAPDQRVSVDVADDHRAVFSLCGNGQRWRVSLNAQAERYDRRWYVANDVMHVEVALGHTDAVNPDALYRAEIEHFLNAVRAGKQSEPAATLADGIRVLEVCAKVQEMAKVGA